MVKEPKTSVSVNRKTLDRIRSHGKMGVDTLDTVINRAFDAFEKQTTKHSNRGH